MPKRTTMVCACLGFLMSWDAVAEPDAEPAVPTDGPALPFRQQLHRTVHRLWAENFLPMASGQLPKDHPINTPSREVTLEVILSPDGKLLLAKVAKASGAPDYDSSAVEVIRAAGAFPTPPEEALSDDGKVHLQWTLARDHRRCALLEILNKTEPVAAAVPLLLGQGREGLARSRLEAASDDEREHALSAFARAWLDRFEDDKTLALQVAAANAAAGDRRGVERLRKALGNDDTLDLAATALARLSIPLCDMVKADVDANDNGRAMRALSVLRLGADGECLAWVRAIAGNKAASPAKRALAARALASRDDPESRATLKVMSKDPSATVRAAAIAAEARAGAGKAAVFRLTALLRDPSPEVRAAATAALVRVGGEEALVQLFLLFREKNPATYERVAAELAALSGEPSAIMLSRFLRKDDRRIRLAGARALATRRDVHAAKAQASLAGSDDPELRLLAGRSLDPVRRKAAASAPEGYAWAESFRALASGGSRLAAADWMVAQFPKLDPAVRVDLFGAWLATNRGAHASATP